MDNRITRKHFLDKIKQSFASHPIVALLGPRQCGKTTLARSYIGKDISSSANYFDLENPIDLARLENPMLALKDLEGLVVIDEIQRHPNLFSLLRVLADEDKSKQFLILGSASRDLIQQSSETLAGRIRYIELTPFNFLEVDDLPHLWLAGGYPNSYLATTEDASFDWRQGYIQTFLERDIPNLGFRIPSHTLHRFWMMLTHYHGQIFNASEIGTALGFAHTSVRHHLDILTGTFMIRELKPWHENIKRRQIKSPKIYFRDAGIHHALVGIKNQEQLRTHPKLGASWQGLVLEQIISHHGARQEECYFWGVHSQAELDLLIVRHGHKHGYEIKYMDAPVLTRSMQQSIDTLQLNSLTVVYPGERNYALADNIQVRGIQSFRD